jgi:hypothetical protein
MKSGIACRRRVFGGIEAHGAWSSIFNGCESSVSLTFRIPRWTAFRSLDCAGRDWTDEGPSSR